MYTVGTTFTKYWNIMEAVWRSKHRAWVPGRVLMREGATSHDGTLGCSDIGVVQGVHNARIVLPKRQVLDVVGHIDLQAVSVAEASQYTTQATQTIQSHREECPSLSVQVGKGGMKGGPLDGRGYDSNGRTSCTRHLLFSLRDSLLRPQVPGAPGLRYNFKESWSAQQTLVLPGPQGLKPKPEALTASFLEGCLEVQI